MKNHELERYSRQINLANFGFDAQLKLKNAHALIVGLGGLGSPAASYLAAAGVGKLSLIDPDIVERSNLARQVIHHECSIGQYKVDSARAQLLAQNPDTQIHSIAKAFDATMRDLIEAADIVLDCSDNFQCRHAVNKLCVDTHTALVSGAAISFEGQLIVFENQNKRSACYACLHPVNNDARAESCSAQGILSPVVGLIGTAQALESIKLLSGVGESLDSTLLLFDGMAQEWTRLTLPKNPNCSVCGV